MERDEERPDAGPQEEGGPEEERGPEKPAEAQAPGPTLEGETPAEPAEAQAAGPTPEGETPAEPAEAQAAGPTPEGEIPSERRPEGPGGYVQTAGISAAAIVIGVALFVAGFWTHALLDDDVDLDPINEALATLNQQTGDIQDILGGAVGDGGSPTPAPVVAASADDDPFIGPADAPVTIIEFSDYQ